MNTSPTFNGYDPEVNIVLRVIPHAAGNGPHHFEGWLIGHCYLSEYVEHVRRVPSEVHHPFHREGGYYIGYEIVHTGVGMHRDPHLIWKRFQLLDDIKSIIEIQEDK